MKHKMHKGQRSIPPRTTAVYNPVPIGAPRRSHTSLPGLRRNAAKLLRKLAEGNRLKFVNTSLLKCGNLRTTVKDVLELVKAKLLRVFRTIDQWKLTDAAMMLLGVPPAKVALFKAAAKVGA